MKIIRLHKLILFTFLFLKLQWKTWMEGEGKQLSPSNKILQVNIHLKLLMLLLPSYAPVALWQNELSHVFGGNLDPCSAWSTQESDRRMVSVSM